jgi:hypothetical protein
VRTSNPTLFIWDGLSLSWDREVWNTASKLEYHNLNIELFTEHFWYDCTLVCPAVVLLLKRNNGGIYTGGHPTWSPQAGCNPPVQETL